MNCEWQIWTDQSHEYNYNRAIRQHCQGQSAGSREAGIGYLGYFTNYVNLLITVGQLIHMAIKYPLILSK